MRVLEPHFELWVQPIKAATNDSRMPNGRTLCVCETIVFSVRLARGFGDPIPAQCRQAQSNKGPGPSVQRSMLAWALHAFEVAL
jgi:hypothetical protein